MHLVIYYVGIFAGIFMLIGSIFLWFKAGMRKAFKDVITYGSKAKWSGDKGIKNKTMLLKMLKSGSLSSTEKTDRRNVKKDIEGTVLLKGSEETVLLKDCYSDDNESGLKIIEEIHLSEGR